MIRIYSFFMSLPRHAAMSSNAKSGSSKGLFLLTIPGSQPMPASSRQKNEDRTKNTWGGCHIFPRHGYYMHSSVYAARTKYSVSLIPMHRTHSHSIHAAASPWALGDRDDFLFPINVSHIRFSGLALVCFQRAVRPAMILTRTDVSPETCMALGAEFCSTNRQQKNGKED